MDYGSVSEAGNCCTYRNPQRPHVAGRRILRNGLKRKAQPTLTTHNVCPIDMLNCLHVKRESHSCEADICGKGLQRCSQTYHVDLDTSEDDSEDDSRRSAQEHSAHCPEKWSEDVSKERIRWSAQEPSAHHRGKRSEDVSKERSRWSAQEPSAHRWRNCYGGVSKERVRWSAQPRPHRWEKPSEYDSKDFIKPSERCEKLFEDEYKKWIRRSVQEPGSRGCRKCCEDISKTCTRCSAQEPCDLCGKSRAKEPEKAEEGCKDQEEDSRTIQEDVVCKQYDATLNPDAKNAEDLAQREAAPTNSFKDCQPKYPNDQELEEMRIKVSIDNETESRKRVEEHSVLLYFPDGRTNSCAEAKKWLTSVFGIDGKLGIRYCLSKGNGFFTVFFENIKVKIKALAFKPYEHNTSVHIFPWFAQVDESGELCSPRAICFPGLPDHLLTDLPAIGKCFGEFVSCVGVIDSTVAKVRKRRADPFVNATATFKACLPDDCADPCIIALVPIKYKLPAIVELSISDKVSVKQPIFELTGYSSSKQSEGIRRRRSTYPAGFKGSKAECIVCWKDLQEQRFLLFPCGHTNLCGSCAKCLWNTTKTCPTCRKRMERSPFSFWM